MLAREIEIALPVELDRQEQIWLVRAYVRDALVSSGMCADFSIRDKGGGNPHAYIMLTLRSLNKSGEKITPQHWQAEMERLSAHNNTLYQQMKVMCPEIQTVYLCTFKKLDKGNGSAYNLTKRLVIEVGI